MVSNSVVDLMNLAEAFCGFASVSTNINEVHKFFMKAYLTKVNIHVLKLYLNEKLKGDLDLKMDKTAVGLNAYTQPIYAESNTNAKIDENIMIAENVVRQFERVVFPLFAQTAVQLVRNMRTISTRDDLHSMTMLATLLLRTKQHSLYRDFIHDCPYEWLENYSNDKLFTPVLLKELREKYNMPEIYNLIYENIDDTNLDEIMRNMA